MCNWAPNCDERYQFARIDVPVGVSVRSGWPTNSFRLIPVGTISAPIALVHCLRQPPYRTLHSTRNPLPASCVPPLHWWQEKPQANLFLVPRLSKVRGKLSVAHSVTMLQEFMRVYYVQADLQLRKHSAIGGFQWNGYERRCWNCRWRHIVIGGRIVKSRTYSSNYFNVYGILPSIQIAIFGRA